MKVVTTTLERANALGYRDRFYHGHDLKARREAFERFGNNERLCVSYVEGFKRACVHCIAAFVRAEWEGANQDAGR